MNAKQHLQAPSSWQEETQGSVASARSEAIQLGLIGSLAGTIAMDLVMVVESLIIGEPVDGFLALLGSLVGGGALVGMVAHLLMGSCLGLIFGAMTAQIRYLHIDSVRKGLWLGVLAGLVTIPLGCIPVALVAGIPIIEMVSFSFLPHLVWGAVLGLIAGQIMTRHWHSK